MAKLGGISSYPMMILLALTCAAIPVYFKRHRHPGQNLWRTTVAPIIVGLGFIGVLVLATENAPFLVGGSR
jgi:amino acid transporter